MTTSTTHFARFLRSTTLQLTALSAAAALALTGCTASQPPAAQTVDSATVTTQAGPLSITDPWIKATDGEMTGVFAQIDNTTSSELQITDVAASVGETADMHETIVQSDGSSVMQEKEGGFTVPANGTLELTPGHNHIMIMHLAEPILPGDEVTVTLTLSNGSTQEFTALAKEYTGAQETYGPDGSLGNNSPHGDHEHHTESPAPTEG